jgi:mono/diheme cytochrome c family protein
VKPSATLTALATLVLAVFFVRAQGRRSTREGVYSDGQAARGQASYKSSCASCHGDTLAGSGAQNPPLAGPDFTTNWTGQTLDDLFEKIQTSMPADHPGALSRATNADILAYILKANKMPAGKNELPSDAEELKQIQFEAAK